MAQKNIQPKQIWLLNRPFVVVVIERSRTEEEKWIVKSFSCGMALERRVAVREEAFERELTQEEAKEILRDYLEKFMDIELCV